MKIFWNVLEFYFTNNVATLSIATFVVWRVYFSPLGHKYVFLQYTSVWSFNLQSAQVWKNSEPQIEIWLFTGSLVPKDLEFICLLILILRALWSTQEMWGGLYGNETFSFCSGIEPVQCGYWLNSMRWIFNWALKSKWTFYFCFEEK